MPGIRYIYKSFACFFLMLLLAVAGPAIAQTDNASSGGFEGFTGGESVVLQINPTMDIGNIGYVRPGTWTPVRMRLVSKAASVRSVLCRWELHDSDGDTVVAEQHVTLSPNMEQSIWLYANPRMDLKSSGKWVFRVLDEETGLPLIRAREMSLGINNVKLLGTDVDAIGVIGRMPKGLDYFASVQKACASNFSNEEPYISHHEYHKIITGLRMVDLPDRWYGLSMFSTLIWTPNGGDPNSAMVRNEMLDALREWVARGGHLILSLPSINEPWTASSLGDMMPVKRSEMQKYSGLPPVAVVGQPRGLTKATPVQMMYFSVDQKDAELSVPVRDASGRPIVVSKLYGFGKITMVGVNLGSVALGDRMPRKYNIWNTLLAWNTPTFPAKYVKKEIVDSRITKERRAVPVSRFIPNVIAMKNKTGNVILLALLVFALYWVIAAPVSYFLLKYKKKHRYSWVVFVGFIGVFTAISWLGAYIMRPNNSSISHFSIVDIDPRTNQSHTHSWMSLYLPTFSNVDIEVSPSDPQGMSRNTVSSPGMSSKAVGASFLDPQDYKFSPRVPNQIVVPFRSTTKSLEVDYMGDLSVEQNGMEWPWIYPTAELRLNSLRLPEGKLRHHFPVPLQNVLMVFCPGDGFTPFVQRLTKGQDNIWHTGETIEIDNVGQQRMAIIPKNFKDREFVREGYLGSLMVKNSYAGLLDQDQTSTIMTYTDTQIAKNISLLSFYSMMPSPDFRRMGYENTPARYTRELGRQMDISKWTSQKCLIVMGILKDCPLPLPMVVDGDVIESKGWTVVRWVHYFE